MDNEQNTTDIIPFRAANSRLYRIICTDSLSVSLLDTDQRSRQLLTSVVHYFESNRFFDTSSGKKTLYSIIDNNKFHLLKQLLTFGDFQEGLIRNPSVFYTLFLKAVSKNRDNCLEVFLNDEVMFSFFLNYLDAQPPQKKINVFKSLWGSCQKNKCFDLLVSKQSFVELYPLDFLINLSAFLIRGANKELSLSVVHRFITSPKLNRQFASLPLFDIPRDLTYRAEQKAKKLQINFKRLLSVLFVYYPKSFQFIKNKLDQLCPDKVDQAFLELFRDFEPLSETIFIVESVPIYSPSFYRIFKNTFSKDAQEYINFSTLFFARLTSKYGESVDMRQSLQKISSILKSLSKDQFYQLNTFLFSHRKHLNIVSNALDFDKIFDNYITKIEYAKVLLEQSLPLSFFDKLEPRAKHFIFSILKDEDLTPILKKTKLSRTAITRQAFNFKKIKECNARYFSAISWITHPDQQYFKIVSLRSLKNLWSSREEYYFSRDEVDMRIWFFSSFANSLVRKNFLDNSEFESLFSYFKYTRECKVSEKGEQPEIAFSRLCHELNWQMHYNSGELAPYIYQELLTTVNEIHHHFLLNRTHNSVSASSAISSTESGAEDVINSQKSFFTYTYPLLLKLSHNLLWPFDISELRNVLRSLEAISITKEESSSLEDAKCAELEKSVTPLRFSPISKEKSYSHSLSDSTHSEHKVSSP